MAHSSFCVKCAEKILTSVVEKEDNFVLFCVNLEEQKTDTFKYSEKEPGGLVWCVVVNASDIWKPIDAGYGQLLKMLIKEEFFKLFDGNSKWSVALSMMFSLAVLKR